MSRKRSRTPANRRSRTGGTGNPDPLTLWGQIDDLVQRQQRGRRLTRLDLRPWASSISALMTKLVEVERRYRIPREDLLARLITPTTVALSFARKGRLRAAEARVKLYQAALQFLGHFGRKARYPESETEWAVLHALVAHAENQVQMYRESQRLAKLEPGRRRASPAQWAVIGDIAADVAFFLSEKIPGRRQGRWGNVLPEAVRPYKAEAINLTAELVTLAYSLFKPGFRITPKQVKARTDQPSS